MRALVGTCLALAAVRGGAAHADPAVPQVNPGHDRREDAQRLREQLRSLEHAAVAPPTSLSFSHPAEVADQPHSRGRTIAGEVMIGSATLAGLTALLLYATAPADPTDDSGLLEVIRPTLAVTSVLVGIGGIGVMVAGRPARIAPTVTPRSVGLAIAGNL